MTNEVTVRPRTTPASISDDGRGSIGKNETETNLAGKVFAKGEVVEEIKLYLDSDTG